MGVEVFAVKPGMIVIVYGSLAVALFLLVAGAWMRMRPDVEMGRRWVENNCGVCHDLTKGRIHGNGPYLWGVFNRSGGSLDGFAYSAAFLRIVRAHPFIWDDDHLDQWITDPSQFIPQTTMTQRNAQHPLSFDGIASDANRRDVIAYLKTLQ